MLDFVRDVVPLRPAREAENLQSMSDKKSRVWTIFIYGLHG